MSTTAIALLFSGSVQALMSPPLGWIALHPVSWIPAFAVFSRLRGRRALAAGWVVGIAAELAIFCWLPGTVARFGGLPMPVAVLVWLLFAAATGFYAAVIALGFARIRRAGGAAWPFAIATWFTAVEFLNPQVFGYLQGVGWYRTPEIFLLSAATGVSGVSFLVIAANAVLLQGFELARKRHGAGLRAWLANLTVLAALIAGAAAYSSARLSAIAAAEAQAEPLRIAVIQPLHTTDTRRVLERGGFDAIARDLVELSRRAARESREPIDAFVWPEGALRSDPLQTRSLPALDFVRESGAEVWTGANHYEARGLRPVVAHNSAFRILADGSVDRRYDKNVLVPFGEYVPLRDVVPGFDRIRTAGNFEAGTAVPVYRHEGATFVFLICYEAIRSAFVREAIGEDVDLIVNVTVDSWYGELSEQSQHLMLAASQSAMLGVPMVRSTTTGISAFIDARGVVVAQTGNFTRETLVGEVRPVRVASLVSRWGDWFAWAAVAASAILLWHSRRRVI